MTASLAFRPAAPAPTSKPLASDHAAMMADLLPLGEELESQEETHNTWTIQDWGSLQKKELGQAFQCGSGAWQILLYPEGNGVDKVSIYLQRHSDPSKPVKNWHACVQFALVLWDTTNPSKYVSHTAAHRFNADEPDWGFTRFCDRKKEPGSLEGDDSPFSGTDGVKLTAYVRVVKDHTGFLWHNFMKYDSKNVTGMVGLKNLGATDYLSCVTQILYHIALFRKTIYQAPTAIIETTDKAWALQHVFSSLQTELLAVSPTKLTDSFGWRAIHLFEPQDAQEFLTILLDSISERLKITPCRNAFRSLFSIESKTNYSCVKVPYKWSKVEETRHIRVNVRNNRTLMDSLKEYTSSDLIKDFMPGDIHNEQDVTRHTSFNRLPSVLPIYLNRVEYDVQDDAMKKLTDYHEFPEELDMAKYLSDEVDKSEPCSYMLFGVVVHASSRAGAHYYTFIRPKPDGQFYKFDDDRVTPATLKEAMNDNYGVSAVKPPTPAKVLEPYHNASRYQEKTATILIYIRKSDADNTLADVLQSDIPERICPLPSAMRSPGHLDVLYGSEPIKEGTAAIGAQDSKLEAQGSMASYMSVKFASTNEFRNHHGFDLMPKFTLGYDPATPLSYSRISESMVVQTLMTTISNDFRISGKDTRIWPLITRVNGTIRPTGPPLGPQMRLEDVRKKHYPRIAPGIQLWIEGDECLYGRKDSEHSSLVFLKYFDVIDQKITGIGHVYVTPEDKPNNLSPAICNVMGWGSDTPISYVEEVKPTLIENMDGEKSMKHLEIGDGDIICFQKLLNSDEFPKGVTYGNACDFYLSGLVK
ncbi:hypothetical protein FQN49_001764 [Arthroderma sp. PD_2]|nr:hypothetical protein FQN49_001764 [Arthroderma sp. PD_2]